MFNFNNCKFLQSFQTALYMELNHTYELTKSKEPLLVSSSPFPPSSKTSVKTKSYRKLGGIPNFVFSCINELSHHIARAFCRMVYNKKMLIPICCPWIRFDSAVKTDFI